MNDLTTRLFDFAVGALRYIRTLPNTVEYKVIKYQLAKSATSVGANYEEAQAGSSKADFLNKVRISLKEIRETNYWLRILKELTEEDDHKLEALIKESKELMLILGAIASKTSKGFNK